MSHALRIRMAVPAAPQDARDRIAAVKSGYRPVLGPATDDPDDQETTWVYKPADDAGDRPEHYESVLRFDARDDRDAILDEVTDAQFPSVKWILVEVHDCRHEFRLAEYADDPDYPHGELDDCGDWNVAFTRGNVPEAFA